MKHRITILEKGLLLIALPLIYQALFLGILLKRLHSHNDAQRLAVLTKDVLVHVDRVYRDVIEAQTAVRGYFLTSDDVFADAADRSIRSGRAEVQWLKNLVADSPEQQAQVNTIAARVEARLGWQQGVFEFFKQRRTPEALAQIGHLEGQALMDSVRDEIDSFRQMQEQLDQQRLETLRRSSVQQNWLLIGGLVVNVVIGAACVAYFSHNLSRRLDVLVQNTERLARGEQLVAPVPGHDEIRDLDRQFHEMAEELARARQKERVFQEALERRNSELTEVNRELDQKSQENEMFVYSVSHDLRSPLVNLQGFSKELGLIRDDLRRLADSEWSDASRDRLRAMVDRDIGESIHYIQTAVERLSRIIDALLRLSRAGRVEYRPEMVEMNAIVGRIVAAMRASITQRGAEVRVEKLPPVWGDPTALEQVFANLIGNAVNYLDPKRPGRIEVGCLPAAGEREPMLTYFVKDNGLGISEPYLPKLFAVFQRLHAKAAPGEGIGLALVRRMVERHGGKVWVESKEGEGSTFFVSLPAGAAESPVTFAPCRESIRLLNRRNA